MFFTILLKYFRCYKSWYRIVIHCLRVYIMSLCYNDTMFFTVVIVVIHCCFFQTILFYACALRCWVTFCVLAGGFPEPVPWFSELWFTRHLLNVVVFSERYFIIKESFGKFSSNENSVSIEAKNLPVLFPSLPRT